MRHNSSTSLIANMDDLFRDLNRYAIGFEPLFTRIHNLSPRETTTYPPYNLDADAEGIRYKLELAVAGFKMDELEITLTNDRVLVVKGSKRDQADRNWIHRGIAARDFERQFTLADRIRVVNAKLEDGLLVIELEREIPEESKARKIPIQAAEVIDVSPSAK